MEHYNVIIMTPGYNMEARYVISLLTTIRELNTQGLTWAFSSVGMSDVALAREATVLGKTISGFSLNYAKPLDGQVTYDKLFLIDSDIYWEVNDFLSLYYSDKDVISGIYLQSDGETTTLFTEVNSKKDLPGTTGVRSMTKYEARSKVDPFEVSGTGLGFTCIKPGVFETIERPWFEHVSLRTRMSDTEYSVEMFSEDISFLHKVTQAGFKVYADPNVLVGHVKKTNVHWY
jgi:hypothetical protein